MKEIKHSSIVEEVSSKHRITMFGSGDIISFISLYWKVFTRFDTSCYFLPHQRCKNCNYLILYYRAEMFFIFGTISDTVSYEWIMFGTKFIIIPFSVSSLSDILSYCLQNNFCDGLDVMSILPNFLLISQTYGLCDWCLFGYITLIVTPCNTG